ncbi:MAG: hypothetical protein JST69_08675, partial [Bacteroidetes bacterium]|nr:hypothetical protein [Bacteroidota bacterium]
MPTRVLPRIFAFIVLAWMGTQPLFAQISITKAIPQNNMCVGSGYYGLSNITIYETSEGQFSVAGGTGLTLIIDAPANFQFQPSTGIVTPSGSDLSNVSLSVTAAKATITFDYTFNGSVNNFVLSGLAVKAVGTPSSGFLTTDPAGTSDATTALAGADYGDLSSELVVANVTGSSLNLCNGSSLTPLNNAVATGGSGPYTYAWSPATGLSSTSVYNPNANPVTTTTYTLTATDANGCSGSNTVAVQVFNPINISTQPSNQTICAGNNVTFSVSATGYNLSYQWQQSTDGGVTFNNIGGATSASYSISGVTTGYNNYQYQVVITSAAPTPCATPVTSSPAVLTVNSLPATSDPSNASICAGASGVVFFVASVSGTGTSLQWQVDNGGGFADIVGAPYTNFNTQNLSISPVSVALNGYKYRMKVTGTCAPPAYSASATLNVQSPPTITTQPPATTTACAGANVLLTAAATGTSLSYQWIDVATGLAPVGAYFSGVNTNSLLISGIDASLNGKQYQLIVSGTCTPNASSVVATLIVQNLPQISGQPANSTLCETTNTSFTVNAGVTTSPTYQWQVSTDGGLTFNNVSGGVYGGASTATLSLTSVPFSYSGYLYRVVVSGACTPSAISSSALLTVQQNAIVNTPPSNASACQNATVSFSVSASGTNLSYQWQENGSNLSNGGIYSGVNTSTLTLTGITLAQNSNKYQVVVKNASGSCTANVTSPFATLTVNKIPDASASDVIICSGSLTNISITNPNATPGTTFTWTVQSSSNSTGAVAGSGNLINQTLTSTDGVNVGSVTYSIVPQSLAGCTGAPFAVNATVNPIPQVTAQGGVAFCPGASINIPLTTNIVGSTVSWTNSNVAIGIPASGLGDLVFTGGSNITGADEVGTITYQATKNGCTGSSKNFNLTIHPSPVVSAQSNVSVCSGGAVGAITFTANTGGGETYNWTNSNPSIG